MTHDLCGRRCRCTDECCLKGGRCICQTCVVNAEDGYMVFPTSRSLGMVHIEPGPGKRLNHVTSRGSAPRESPWREESVCRGCGRLVPLIRLVVAGEGDTFSESWIFARHVANGDKCSGSGAPPWVPGPGEFASLLQRLKSCYPA